MQTKSPNLVPVILCGGAGVRLWPVSRQQHPKPFMTLPDGLNLLQKTYMRAAQLPEQVALLTVTNRDYYFKVQDSYAAFTPILPVNKCFMLEPTAKNTAPAILLASLYVQRYFGDDAILLILPADHVIADQAALEKDVSVAMQLAAQDYLVTFGIKPTYPETGFGYLKAGDPIGKTQAYRVQQFMEKPDKTRAMEYVAQPDYFWNAGMFCFKSRTVLDAYKKLSPDLFKQGAAIFDAMTQASDDDRIETLNFTPAQFEAFESISFDYAIMEKADNVAVCPAHFDWNDIGSWLAMSELLEAGKDGNRSTGTVVMHDVKNTFVHSESRLVSLLGVENLVVVDTPDALLISQRDRVQDVRQIVQQLNDQQHPASSIHRTVHRPWGSYTVLEETSEFKMKRIEVHAGQSLSLQMHKHRSEHWVVVQGVANVVNGEDTLQLKADQSTYIPAGNKHRLSNLQQETLILVEVQTGRYLGEDDIVRFEDRYGRETHLAKTHEA